MPRSRVKTASSRRRVLSIAQRLHAKPGYSGKGLCIAFLDSGFYAHPDLTTPRNRILAYADLVKRKTFRSAPKKPDPSAWHGMMTSVVAAGNGALSKRRFAGLASDADVVLVKVGTAERIAHDDIRRGIDWVIRHREQYGIRVLNISCGGDWEESYHTDRLSRSAERAVAEGIVVVAAVGNDGHRAHPRVLPPASAPSVLAVGGFDDGGEGFWTESYHSSYGPTIDGLLKPEIVAPAIWVAAPILPGTSTAAQAELLAELDAAADSRLSAIIRRHPGVDDDLTAIANRDAYLIRQLCTAKHSDQQLLDGYTKHVDGTSFSAPIVSSVVAQMLEANPNLSPQDVRRCLIRKARRLPNIELDRQGWGVVRPRESVKAAIDLR